MRSSVAGLVTENRESLLLRSLFAPRETVRSRERERERDIGACPFIEGTDA